MNEKQEEELVTFYTTYLEGAIDAQACFRDAFGSNGIRTLLQETVLDIIRETRAYVESDEEKGAAHVLR